MDKPRKEYDETHSTTSALPLGLGDPIYVTNIEHPETHERSEGCGWDRETADENAERNLRTKNTSYNGYHAGESKESGGGGCYLTTACTSAEGLPDNCYQLEALRDVRDNTLGISPEGRQLIASYYKLAPKIVRAIDQLPNANAIWKDIYADVNVAASLAMSGLPDEAIKHYEEMTLGLAKIYLN
jgi:hypothetical protein